MKGINVRSIFQKAQIQDRVKQLISDTRYFSKAQKALWQKVPYMALQADGRTGYKDSYYRAYECGYWGIEASIIWGCYTMYVDLETGELVDATALVIPAMDQNILLVAGKIDELDASLVLQGLREESQEPTGSYYNEVEQNEWRSSLQQELGLNPETYRRRKGPAEVAEDQFVSSLID